MALTTLNTATLVGNLAADAEVKTVEASGSPTQVLEATIYVRRRRDRDSSFTVELSIWEGSSAWGARDYLKKGSLIAVYGSVEPSPYITSTSSEPRAGLQINPVDRLELISVKGKDEADGAQPESAEAAAE
jgi:single-stranded DNA-binding protein